MRLIIAGGGTGGHVFPALAVAEAVLERDSSAQILFVGTRRGFEAKAVPAAGHKLAFIRIAGLKSVGFAARIRGLGLLPLSFVDSWSILSEFRPQVVLGVGGYASGPLVMAAWIRRIATAICEQNSVPGFTNRVLGRFVQTVFGSFETSRSFFDDERFRLVGNPVRSQITTVTPTERADAFRILVLGGSQGARPLNQQLPQGFALAIQQSQPLQIVHQTGQADVEAVTQAYSELGVSCEVRPFIDDMAAAYSQADLVVTRSGATTCAELSAIGMPSVFIPFPQAADDHQTVNAASLVDAGAAVLLPQSQLNAQSLSDTLQELLSNQGQKLGQMRRAARASAQPNASTEVATALERLAQGGQPK